MTSALRIRGGAARAIADITSLDSHVPAFGSAAYPCAKAGVEMLSRDAALELARHRIRVNTGSPGLTDTPLTAGLRDVAGLEGRIPRPHPPAPLGHARGRGRRRALPRERRRGLRLGREPVRGRRVGDERPGPRAVPPADSRHEVKRA